MGRRIQGFTDEALQLLIDYDWPGNVRQLKNVVERLVIMADEKILDHAQVIHNLHPPQVEGLDQVPQTSEDLKKAKRRILQSAYAPLEKAFLQAALEAAGGNISRAADRVGMQRSNFSALMKKHRVGTKNKSSTP
jgi:two-component system NtrC family response regulator